MELRRNVCYERLMPQKKRPAAKRKERIPIPSDVKRQVTLEAGCKCCMTNCTAEIGLQIHHIDEDPSNNDPSNLILLCANHHTLATEGKVDRKACRQLKQLAVKRAAPPTIDYEKLAVALASQLVEGSAPKPLQMESLSLQEAAVRIESEIASGVELLARSKEALYVWISPRQWDFRQLKAVFLAIACLVSGDPRAQTVEIGLANISGLSGSLGSDDIGVWRVVLDLRRAGEVCGGSLSATKFWADAIVLLTAGDNFRIGQFQIPFSEFEARTWNP
jgi:hypothetical protein